MGSFLCVTCDRALQAGIAEGFWVRLATMFLPLIAGVLLATWLVHRVMARRDARSDGPRGAPLATAGLLIGIGMGGFADGIVFHQLLQWHQMLSSTLPPITLEAKSVNMFWDGVFHLATWTITACGVGVLLRATGRRDVLASGKLFASAALLGWGVFNVLEGVANHYVLGYHDVREVTGSPALWNAGFLAFGLAQVLVGALGIASSLRAPRARLVFDQRPA